MGKPYEVPKLTRLVWHSLEELQALMGEQQAKRKARRPRAPKRALTPRQREILWLCAWGHSRRRIGLMLGIKHGTVRNHITNAFTRLGVDNMVDAVVTAHQLGEISVKGVMRWHLE